MGLMKGRRVENIGGIVKELLKLRGKGNNLTMTWILYMSHCLRCKGNYKPHHDITKLID